MNLDCDFPMMKQPPPYYDYITYSQSMHHVTIFPLQSHTFNGGTHLNWSSNDVNNLLLVHTCIATVDPILITPSVSI